MKARHILWLLALAIILLGVFVFVWDVGVCFERCTGLMECMGWALACASALIRGVVVLAFATIIALLLLAIAKLAEDNW